MTLKEGCHRPNHTIKEMKLQRKHSEDTWKIIMLPISPVVEKKRTYKLWLADRKQCIYL